MEFTVKRSEWFRGKGPEESALCRIQDSKMCCLGFFAQEEGFTQGDITGVADPESLMNSAIIPERVKAFDQLGEGTGKGIDWMWVGKDLMTDLMGINDVRVRNQYTRSVAIEGRCDLVEFDSEEDGVVKREEYLTELFELAGHQVEFVD